MNTTFSPGPQHALDTRIGTGGVVVAGVALVVSASTFVSEFNGFIQFGAAYAVALVVALCVILPVTIAAADLAVTHQRIGGIYRFVRSVISGPLGKPAAVFCSLAFLAAFLFGSAGEIMAGAHALRALVGAGVEVRWCVLLLLVPAAAINLRGLRCATWVTGALLALMLGVRWGFGLGGFAGLAATGDWRLDNLEAAGVDAWASFDGLFGGGLALALWSFVGIESTAQLASEVRDPARSLPRGIWLGLAVILITTLVMGIGSMGTQPRASWLALLAPGSEEAPHLIVGSAMFGEPGRIAMAVASIAATWSTLVIALAAVPRIIVAMARDQLFFGRASAFFAQVDPRTGVPIRATLLVLALQVVVLAGQATVVNLLYAAAYLWFFRYLVLLALAAANRVRSTALNGVLGRRALLATATFGSVLVFAAWQLGFEGRHAEFGGPTLAVLGAVLVCGFVAWMLEPAAPRARAVSDPRLPALSPKRTRPPFVAVGPVRRVQIA